MGIFKQLVEFLATPRMPYQPARLAHNHTATIECGIGCPRLVLVPEVMTNLNRWAIPFQLVVPHFANDDASLSFAVGHDQTQVCIDLLTDGEVEFQTCSNNDGKALRVVEVNNPSYLFVMDQLMRVDEVGAQTLITTALRSVHVWPHYYIDQFCMEIEWLGRQALEQRLLLPETEEWLIYPREELADLDPRP